MDRSGMIVEGTVGLEIDKCIDKGARKSHLWFASKGIASLSPIFHIHVSVSDLYIPRIRPHIFLQQNR
jgi:hypothetical protein